MKRLGLAFLVLLLGAAVWFVNEEVRGMAETSIERMRTGAGSWMIVLATLFVFVAVLVTDLDPPKRRRGP